MPADVRPAARESLHNIRPGQRSQRDEHSGRHAPAEDDDKSHDQRDDQADQSGDGKQNQNRRNVHLCGEQGRAVPGHAEEQRLAKAENPGVTPDQVETQREQAEDENASDEQRPEIIGECGKDQTGAQDNELQPRNDFPQLRRRS